MLLVLDGRRRKAYNVIILPWDPQNGSWSRKMSTRPAKWSSKAVESALSPAGCPHHFILSFHSSNSLADKKIEENNIYLK